MYTNTCSILVINLLLCLFSSALHAENIVSGTVCDMSGAPVQDAQVTVISEYMVRHIAYTDENGGYQVALPYYPVAVEEQPVQTFSLDQNYPNPFNPGTVIPYTLSEPSHVELTIYSILGQKVQTLVSDYQSPGDHQVYWKGCDRNGYGVAAGVYLYTLSAGGSFQAKKMLLLDGHSGSGVAHGAAIQKVAQSSQTKVEEQTYTVLVKAPGYMIFDETINVEENDYLLDISLEETQDAGTYTIPDPEEKWYLPDLYSYIGGYGTLILAINPSEDFRGTVSLSVNTDPAYHAGFTSYVLDKEHPITEFFVYPELDVVINDYMDSLYVISQHEGMIDSLKLIIFINPFHFSGEGREEILDKFIEWVSSSYTQYSMFDDMEWLSYDKNPGATGGENWAYINDSFEVLGVWGMDLDYFYYTIRPRDQSEYIFAAREGLNGFEEIPVEDAVSKIITIQRGIK